jgi:hypothetical protein
LFSDYTGHTVEIIPENITDPEDIYFVLDPEIYDIYKNSTEPFRTIINNINEIFKKNTVVNYRFAGIKNSEDPELEDLNSGCVSIKETPRITYVIIEYLQDQEIKFIGGAGGCSRIGNLVKGLKGETMGNPSIYTVTLAHEIAHIYSVGHPEYYTQNVGFDFSETGPFIGKPFAEDLLFFNTFFKLYINDPMGQGISDPLFGPLSAFLLNRGFGNLNDNSKLLSDFYSNELSNLKIKVIDENNNPLESVEIKGYQQTNKNINNNDITSITDENGEANLDYSKTSQQKTTNRIFKFYKEGYLPRAIHLNTFMLQEAKFIREKSPEIIVKLLQGNPFCEDSDGNNKFEAGSITYTRYKSNKIRTLDYTDVEIITETTKDSLFLNNDLREGICENNLPILKKITCELGVHNLEAKCILDPINIVTPNEEIEISLGDSYEVSWSVNNEIDHTILSLEAKNLNNKKITGNPEIISSILDIKETALTKPQSIKVNEGYAYISNFDFDKNGLEIVNIKDPLNPKHVKALLDGEFLQEKEIKIRNPKKIEIYNHQNKKYVYVSTSDGISLFDITNPESPIFEKSLFSGFGSSNAKFQSIKFMKIFDNKLYISSIHEGGKLVILDLSNPLNPQEESVTNIEGISNLDIFEQNNNKYMYITSSSHDKIAIFDITDSQNPLFIDNVDDPQGKIVVPKNIKISKIDNNIFAFIMSSSEKSITILDMSPPSNPTIIKHFFLNPRNLDPNERLLDSFIKNKALLIRTSIGLKIYDISEPVNLKSVGSISDKDELSAGLSEGFFATTENAYISTNGGMKILDISNYPLHLIDDNIRGINFNQPFKGGTYNWEVGKLKNQNTLDPGQYKLRIKSIEGWIDESDVPFTIKGNNVPTTIPILHYDFENMETGQVDDKSGNSNNGVIFKGVKIVPDNKGGTGLEFDGVNDYLAIRRLHYSLEGEIDKVTLCSWFSTSFKGTKYNDNWALIDFDRTEFYNLFINAQTGKVIFSTAGEDSTNDANTAFHNIRSTQKLNDGVWHHTCAVFNSKEKNDKKIYIDGVLNTEEDAYPDNTKLGRGGALIRYGFIGDGSEAETFDGKRNNLYYKGLIDDVRIYSEALNAEQIQEIYNS